MFVPSLRLGGLARLRACQVFVLSRRRLPSAFVFEQCVINVRVAWMASRDCVPAGLRAGLCLSHTKARGKWGCLQAGIATFLRKRHEYSCTAVRHGRVCVEALKYS